MRLWDDSAFEMSDTRKRSLRVSSRLYDYVAQVGEVLCFAWLKAFLEPKSSRLFDIAV
jgi:hypothetical protein